MMRLDHVLLAVRDLEAATRDYRQRLGMDARVGGSHPGRGTHNSLVHFRTAYLELISVEDPSQPRAQELVRLTEDGDAPHTFALAVADLEAASETLRARGLHAGPPREGSRRTPEGVLLRWRSADLRPGSDGPAPDSPPLPFLIEWASDEAGRAWFADRVELSRHDLPWGNVGALLIASPDPRQLADEYERLFGWRADRTERHAVLHMPGGDAVSRSLGPAPRVALVEEPFGDSVSAADAVVRRAVATRLRRHGAGVIGLALTVPSIAETVRALRDRGAAVETAPDGRWAAVAPEDAHGLLLELVE